MQRPLLIFVLFLMSGPALAAINPLHDVIVAAKPALLEPAPLANVAVLFGDKEEKTELPLECSGYYLRPHKATDLSRCN
jgi:hypothetical protein